MTVGPIRTLNLCGQCHRPVRVELGSEPATVECPHCHAERDLEPGAVVDGKLVRCPWCACPELYRQRDFHQTLGCAVMVIAALVSVVVNFVYGGPWWLLPLGVGVAIDATMYRLLPDRAGCYSCHAEFRAVPNLDAISRYDLHDATRIEYAGPRPPPTADR